MTFDTVLCSPRRAELHAQANGFSRDAQAATRVSGNSFVKAQTVAGGQTSVTGDQATTVVGVTLEFSPVQRQAGDPLVYRSAPHIWTFHLVRDHGWRVCQVDAPALCTDVLTCSAPSAPIPNRGGSPEPSPSDDLLGGVRDMLPCGPRDPFPALHHCPSPVGAENSSESLAWAFVFNRDRVARIS